MLNGEKEEIEAEEMPVAVGTETSALMQTIIASSNEEAEMTSEKEYTEDVVGISDVSVEVGEIPVVSNIELNCSLKLNPVEQQQSCSIELNQRRI